MINGDISQIRKIARIRDKAKAADNYLEVIEFPTSDSTTGKLELLPSVVRERSAFQKRLVDSGAILPKDGAELKSVLENVAVSDAPDEWVYESQTGWIEDRKAFVLVGGVIGNAETKIIGVNQAKAIADRSGQLSTTGDWKGWRDTVAEPARHSTTMMLAASIPFAAPLLSVLGLPSFTINLFGRSRTGKSVATLVSASAMGAGRIEDLISWKITDARLDQRLPEFNDTLFPIDDLNKMGGKDKEKYKRIRDLTYSVSAGAATGRHSSFTAAHEGAHRIWHSIVLTSSEKSVSELAHKAREERQHGEAIRLIDVPAALYGLDHIFDRPPADLDARAFVDWKRKIFKSLVDACAQNHGEVFRKYVSALIAEGDKLKPFVEQRIFAFSKRVTDKFDGDIARDVAEKFGLIYAGGLLGIRYKLLPWEEGELLDAVKNAYLAARDFLPDDGILLRQGVTVLREKRRGLPRLTKSAAAKTDFDGIDGYRQHRKKANFYVIKREVFNSLFASGTQQALVIEWLIKKQRITLATPKASAGASPAEPKSQVMWPDGKRRRSIEIQWRRKQKKMKKGAADKAK